MLKFLGKEIFFEDFWVFYFLCLCCGVGDDRRIFAWNEMSGIGWRWRWKWMVLAGPVGCVCGGGNLWKAKNPCMKNKWNCCMEEGRGGPSGLGLPAGVKCCIGICRQITADR